MKIALVRCGGGVCGVSSSEESLSNAGIIFSPFLKILTKTMGAQVHILGPIQKKTEELLKNKDGEYYRDYFENFHIPQRVEDEPEDVDVILVDSGSDNLRLDGNYLGFHGPTLLFVYRIFKKYKKVPVIVFQTDFAAPFPLSNHYGSWYHKFYNVLDLFRDRRIHVIAAGTNKFPYMNFRRFYKMEEIVKIHQLGPTHELHSIIDLDDINKKFEVPDLMMGIGFAGKQRIEGDRGPTIEKYIEQNVPFCLAGKWDEHVIANFTRKNPYFKFRGRLKNYENVLELYNQLGSTIYISAPEYNDGGVVTSRFYDAIKSCSIPFIHAPDHKVVQEQFGTITNELLVTPENIHTRMQDFSRKETRERVLVALYQRYVRNLDKAREDVVALVQSIASNKEEPVNLTALTDQLAKNYRDKLKYSRNIDKSPENIDLMVNKHVENSATSEELFNGRWSKDSKVQLGIWFSHQKEEGNWSDVSKETIDQLNKFFAPNEEDGIGIK